MTFSGRFGPTGHPSLTFADRWTRWRAPRTKSKLIDEPSQSSGFLDGDLLARFLELDAASPKMKTILDGTKRAEALELDHAQLRELIEELQIIH